MSFSHRIYRLHDWLFLDHSTEAPPSPNALGPMGRKLAPIADLLSRKSSHKSDALIEVNVVVAVPKRPFSEASESKRVLFCLIPITKKHQKLPFDPFLGINLVNIMDRLRRNLATYE
jgi:hypothetical protein